MFMRMLKSAILGLMTVIFTVHLVADGKETEKTGNHAKSKEFEVKVEKLKDKVRITAKGLSGYHCNTLYPWKLTVRDPLKEDKIYKKEDAKKFSNETVVFEVPHIKGQAAKLKMSICNDMQCIMHEESISW